jgi:GNAT superfamily N-acetyltransferase
MGEPIIEPVPHRKQDLAMRFLIGGARRDHLTDAQASILRESTLLRAPERTELWWGRRGRRPVASALSYEQVGRTALLFCSPAAAEGIDRDVLTDLVRQLSRHVLKSGASMIQALLPADDRDNADMLVHAGYQLLAELVYMRLPLNSHPLEPSAQPPGVSWLRYGEFDEAQLAAIIARSYQQSLDVPLLAGARELPDVIAGHKASGAFTPQNWWVARFDGDDAGCILVNDLPASCAADVVYMGVAPEHRRRGLARAMLGKAAAVARSRGAMTLSLAVDSRNMPAVKAYEAQGFRAVDRRAAMVMLRRDLPAH